MLFNPRIRVCRIVLSPPLPAALSLCSPPTPSAAGVVRLYVCVRLHLQPPTCAIPSAIGNSQRRRRFIAPSLRPSFRLPRRQSTPRVALSSSSPSDDSYCFFLSFSSWIPRGRCSSRELNGERIARRASGKESTIRPRNWVTRGRSRGIGVSARHGDRILREEVSLSLSRSKIDIVDSGIFAFGSERESRRRERGRNPS